MTRRASWRLMAVQLAPLTPAPMTASETREEASAWYAAQIAILKARHGDRWSNQAEALWRRQLEEVLRTRLVEIGWKPKDGISLRRGLDM